MAKQANRMMIGGFVVGAVVLLIASIVVFGSGRFFKKTNAYILYFEGSIKGLNIGAPVLFQGVDIGSVKSIVLHIDPDQKKADIPVIIEIEPDRFKVVESTRTTADYHKETKEFIDMGLRAVLTTQSFITGQLMIELDFFPGSPVNLKHTGSDLPQIPTIPSTAEKLAQTFQKLDLEGIKNSLENTLAGIDRLVNNPDLSAGLESMKGTFEQVQLLAGKVNAQMDPLAEELRGTLGNARKLVHNLNSRVEPLADDAGATMEEFGRLARDINTRLGATLAEMDRVAAAAAGVVHEDAPLIVQMERTLREFSDAARSLRELTDYLERHPEALIRGKAESKGN